jgi:Nucleotidyl transferase AbiEii toxin, Type IV TA system
MVAGVLKSSQPQLHFDVLPEATRKAFLNLSKNADWLKSGGWYLAGGTALALQAGHRASVDLDFFTTHKNFEVGRLENTLLAMGGWRTDMTDKGTIYGVFQKAKVSFIAYPFFRPSKDKLSFGNIALLKASDIAVMKIIAISQRGRKRDFVDLYWYCNNLGDLEKTFHSVQSQYPQEHNLSHILKSLTFFEDAEKDPMPNLNFSVSWQGVKAYFLREVPRLAKKFLDLN